MKCSNCGRHMKVINNIAYCPYCGQREVVKWLKKGLTFLKDKGIDG